jgi:hypothetical protein
VDAEKATSDKKAEKRRRREDEAKRRGKALRKVSKLAGSDGNTFLLFRLERFQRPDNVLSKGKALPHYLN